MAKDQENSSKQTKSPYRQMSVEKLMKDIMQEHDSLFKELAEL